MLQKGAFLDCPSAVPLPPPLSLSLSLSHAGGHVESVRDTSCPTPSDCIGVWVVMGTPGYRYKLGGTSVLKKIL